MTNMRASRPIGAVLAALAVALTAVALVVLSSGEAEAKPPKFRVVTKDFANTARILVPAPGLNGDPGPAQPYPSVRSVSGLTRGKILDVDVRLRDFEHAVAAADVDMVLVGPGRTGSARVLSDVGGEVDFDPVDLVIDDEAPGFMPKDGALRSGRFKPTNYPEVLDFFPNTTQPSGNRLLSVFDGKNPNGNWRLFAADDLDDGGGAISGGWSVTIKAKVKR